MFMMKRIKDARLWQQKILFNKFPAASGAILMGRVTSNFHLFLELKNWLGDQSFHKKKELQSNVKAHFTSLAATFFEEEIGKLVYRYDKCLSLHCDYVEN
ncbi:hypothetical protein AVEN_24112-1 [Araneus ventricosus]|uniref:Uncharacterized protein n=1 Tax=Araneus ventricosus TaxID=182803 RepID=A0A4Y2N0N2_ARAVE|nr:hypothetical protein AVEN_24112-1 [Araneus ventricosus]